MIYASPVLNSSSVTCDLSVQVCGPGDEAWRGRNVARLKLLIVAVPDGDCQLPASLLAQATGLSGPEFGVLSRLAALGKGEMRQQALASVMAWDKSRLSHQLTRMQERALIVW